MTLQTCAFNWVLGVPAAKLMKRSSRASDKVNQRLAASVGNNKHPARMSPAMPDFTLNSLRQRFRSSPDVGCRAFCIPLRLWWSVEQEKCVHTCSRPPSTGAQTPSCTLVNAASKEAPMCNSALSCFMEDELALPWGTPNTVKREYPRWPEDVGPMKQAFGGPLDFHKSTIDPSGNYVSSHLKYISSAMLAPSVDRWGNLKAGRIDSLKHNTIITD